MAAVVLVLIGLALIVARKDLAAAAIRPFFGLLLVLCCLDAALARCDGIPGSGGGSVAPLPLAVIVVGYVAGVISFLYWRHGHEYRERRRRELDRARDAERQRILPPEDTEDIGVR